MGCAGRDRRGVLGWLRVSVSKWMLAQGVKCRAGSGVATGVCLAISQDPEEEEEADEPDGFDPNRGKGNFDSFSVSSPTPTPYTQTRRLRPAIKLAREPSSLRASTSWIRRKERARVSPRLNDYTAPAQPA